MSSESGSVIVTGAAGFIGSHLCDRLLSEGYRVVGIDDLNHYYDPQIKRHNARGLATSDRGELIEADICDAAAMRDLFEQVQPEIVVHLAARAGVRPSIEAPMLYTQVNVSGTVSLLDAAVGTGVKKFVMASSSSVYGNCDTVPFHEGLNVDAPISPYAATKKACELIGHTYWHLHRLPVTCLRFFTVYGPRQRPDLAIHKFMRMIAAGQAIPVYGDGSTSRDYTYIDDIIDGVRAAMERCEGYHIYNLGGNAPVMLSELIEKIEKTVGTVAKIDRQPMQPGDVERTYADLTRVSEELGFAPKTSMDEGLTQQWEWLREILALEQSA